MVIVCTPKLSCMNLTTTRARFSAAARVHRTDAERREELPLALSADLRSKRPFHHRRLGTAMPKLDIEKKRAPAW